jgi:hypothetical protein
MILHIRVEYHEVTTPKLYPPVCRVGLREAKEFDAETRRLLLGPLAKASGRHGSHSMHGEFPVLAIDLVNPLNTRDFLATTALYGMAVRTPPQLELQEHIDLSLNTAAIDELGVPSDLRVWAKDTLNAGYHCLEAFRRDVPVAFCVTHSDAS